MLDLELTSQQWGLSLVSIAKDETSTPMMLSVTAYEFVDACSDE